MLKVRTAYMMNRKGTLIELPEYHPYLIDIKDHHSVLEQMERVIKFNLDDLLWFYKNTDSCKSKELIKTILAYLRFDKRYKDNYVDQYGNYITRVIDNYFDDSVYDIDTVREISVEDLWKELSDNLNEEFTRVRTSHKNLPSDANKDIYFRISSKYTNWFDSIWQVVYDNKNWIESVTIVTDLQSRGEEKFYTLDGQKTDHMKVKDFINLKGNPIVEELQQKYHIY